MGVRIWREIAAPAAGRLAMTVEVGGKVDFGLTRAQVKLQRRCRDLAADFASRATAHDRDASHPSENYDMLRARKVSRTDRAQGMGRRRVRLSRPHDRLRGARPGLSLHRARLQHARLGGDAGIGKPGGHAAGEAPCRRSGGPPRQADRRQFLGAGHDLADRRAAARRARGGRPTAATASPAARCSPRCSRRRITAW